ncbi:bifunctional diaminohydroxyphosphoribosylaminopyrimidine deaminase/5-amino-6-(5-phosphoribosylamino)uracil reductase RibD [Glacieibacterium frigidum]|uniref:Riboflavin biosynthesis protein RibD n=1 Tax=Glacieibacterium frigidum TaxID=2593303 RepID=A0A552U851_9SPHN|nr:bifunctional diaminohydroxyphosphoribosylaminopyrimidine deaminase/5-amino-6-(5-phosphoribosylamino)uracil reductase RibD [Glacieibacterium frigidum]TRW14381.1 bifunctional diaminohydroxyphosphoribosylaminopyrimidine deaminase/5-amino-6-(5-phosphoribosylamino)uracil reductase RibD [Glacieibacterium frigidum]
MTDDERWMGAALALGERGRGRTAPNPCVGCVIVADRRVVGRGWTQPSGRPHAEAMAVAQAGDAARGATAYVTLEPCAAPGRGPACADVLIDAGVAAVVVAIQDPFAAVDGKGLAKLRAAGITVRVGARAAEAKAAMAGFLTRQRHGRPHVTLKLALSLDGAIALASGESRWITGPAARAHAHLERARCDGILVGRGTYDADAPRLDVRLPGLTDRSPHRLLLTHGAAPAGWTPVASPEAIAALPHSINDLLIEGGAGAASAFLGCDLVDRLLIYRAPILVGAGKPGLGDIGLTDLAAAHGRWRRTALRLLGVDVLEVYERTR